MSTAAENIALLNAAEQAFSADMQALARAFRTRVASLGAADLSRLDAHVDDLLADMTGDLRARLEDDLGATQARAADAEYAQHHYPFAA